MNTDGGSGGGPVRMLAGRIRAAAERRRSSAAYSHGAVPGDRAPAGTGGQPGGGGPGAAWQAHATGQADATGHAESYVPSLLRHAADWSWRLLLVAAVAYLAFRVAVALRLFVLPFIAAILLSALLQPLTARLRRIGFPALAATWATLLLGIVILAGLVTLIATQVQADYPNLVAQLQRTAHGLQSYLARPPFRLRTIRLEQLSTTLVNYLAQHRNVVAGAAVTGGRIFIETLTGLILTVFITFFFLKDGRRIWTWLLSGLHPPARARWNRAGDAAWHVLVNYIRGTTVVALIHAVFIGLALWLLGVPLLVPLVILVFIAAYVPLIGILVVGALAILVTLATKGWLAAVILLAVFLAENQLESHLLQPMVVGRAVRIHPLGVIVVLAIGGIVAGIPGAIVAVPSAAVVAYAWPYLRHDGGTLPPPEPGQGAGMGEETG